MTTNLVTFELDIKKLKYRKSEKIYHSDKTWYSYKTSKVNIEKVIEDTELKESYFGSSLGMNKNKDIRKSLYLESDVFLKNEELIKIKSEGLKLVPETFVRAFKFPNLPSYKDVNINGLECKILVYKEGNFFVKHKDSKKLTDIATVLIFPPAIGDLEHTGGKLKIYNFDGTITEFDSSLNKEYKVIIFNKNLEHEVEPITSGNRVVIKFTLEYDLKLFNIYNTPVNLDSLEDLEKLQPKKLQYKKEDLIEYFKDCLEKNWDEKDLIIQKMKDKISEYDDSTKLDSEEILRKVKNSNYKICLVVLSNYYMDPNPKLFYDEDLELLKVLKKNYPRIRIRNEECKINIGSKYDPDEEILDREEIYFHSDSMSIYSGHNIWVNDEKKTGILKNINQEYNDECYDVSQHRNVTVFIIEK